QMLISAIVVTVALASARGYFMYLPQRAPLAAIEPHVDAPHKKNQQAKADLANGSVARLKAQSAEYEASLRALQTLVPKVNEVPALLENVSTAARRVGLVLASVEPMPLIVGEQFGTYSYKGACTQGL